MRSRFGQWGAAVRRGMVAKGLMSFEQGASRAYARHRQAWPPDGPQTLAEKIQYKMMYDRRPILRTFADKIAVREYVKMKEPDLALPTILRIFESVDELMAALPPAPWVLKASHGSGMVVVVREHDVVDLEAIRRLAAGWLRTDYSLKFWEWQYHGLPRRLLLEELLVTESHVPDDFKFYVMNGKVSFVTIDRGRYRLHTRDLLTRDWSDLRCQTGREPLSDNTPPRPSRLDEMIAIAESLSAGMDFLRVDLYQVGEIVYFGELTSTPAAGIEDFIDREASVRLSAPWILPPREAIATSRNGP